MRRYLAGPFLGALLLWGCGGDSPVTLDPAAPPAPPPAPVSLTPAPRAVRDFILIGDQAELTNDLFANDSVQGGTVVSFDPVATQGRLVSVSPEGVLTYTPPPGGSVRETFTYTVQNEGGSSTATVTLTQVFTRYVDASAADPGDGSKQMPFQSLNQAFAAIGSEPVQLVVAPGDYSTTTDPVVTLAPNQHIVGSDPNNRPIFKSQFLVPKGSCTLQNLELQGTGVKLPLIAFAPSDGPDDLILQNLLVTNHVGEGIRLVDPDGTQLNGCTVSSVDQEAGAGAVFIHNPGPFTEISNLTILDNPVGGLVVKNDRVLAIGQGLLVNGLTLGGVNNPVQANIELGPFYLGFENVKCSTDDLSGSLFGLDVGVATVNMAVFTTDLSALGANTAVLDWQIGPQSTVNFQLGPTTNSNNPLLGERNNPITIVNQGNLQFVSVGTSLSSANPVSITGASGSTTRIRYESYPWKSSSNLPRPTFTVHTQAGATTDARVAGKGNPTSDVLPIIAWITDEGGQCNIENLTGFLTDNPNVPVTWTGWFSFADQVFTVNDPEEALNGPGDYVTGYTNYASPALGTLGINQYNPNFFNDNTPD